MEHRKDYLIDYYAVLGLERFADISLIRTAWVKRRARLSPDRVQGMEFEAEAVRRSTLLNEANEVLSDESRKAEYDALLRSWEGTIAVTHDVTIIGGRTFSLGKLLYPEETQVAEGEVEAMMKRLRCELTGFDQDVFDVVEAAFKAASDPTLSLRRAYARVLAQREAELAHQEAAVWQSLGFDNHFEDTDVGDPAGQLEKSLDSARNRISAEVRDRMLQLEGSEPLLLSEGVAMSGLPGDPAEAIRKVEELAFARFATGEDELRRLVGARAELNDARSHAAVHSWYGPPDQPMTPKVLLAIMQGDTCRGTFCFEFSGNNVRPMENIPEWTPPDLTRPLSEWKGSAIDLGFSVLFLEFVSTVPIMTQISIVLERHFDRLPQTE